MHSQSALIRSQSHLDLIHDTAHQESLISHLDLICVTGNVKISHLHLFHITAHWGQARFDIGFNVAINKYLCLWLH